MGFVIAITGKGGVGKTTLAGIIIKQLIANNCTPVLAVDADPNSCFDSMLGVKIPNTIGRLREETRDAASKGLVTGISKQQLLELKIAESLLETKDFDMLSMGRPEGEGCYCYANNVLKSAIGQVSSGYPYIVIDNEAGLENLSRRIVQKVDVLVIVADPSVQGLTTVTRLHLLANEMKIKYSKLVIVINRLRNGQLPEVAAALKSTTGAEIIVGLPGDAQIAENAEKGVDVFALPLENPVVTGINDLVMKLIKPA